MNNERKEGCDSMEEDFDLEFTSDEDVVRWFDEFVDRIRDDVIEQESKIAVLNPGKLAQIRFVYSTLKFLTRDMGVTVTYELNKPFKGSGGVYAEGKVIDFLDSKWFAKLARIANNTEVYPLVKDKVRLAFGFYGLTVPIDAIE